MRTRDFTCARELWIRIVEKGLPSLTVLRAAICIFNEQLLPWSYLSAWASRPTVLVGSANDSWTKHTIIPKYQAAALHAWGRLFGKPGISATNY